MPADYWQRAGRGRRGRAGSKCSRLENPNRITDEGPGAIEPMRESALKTREDWSIRVLAIMSSDQGRGPVV